MMCVCVCVGHPGGRKVEVQYVDFGNKNILPVSDLRKIKDEFFALPSMVRTDHRIHLVIFLLLFKKNPNIIYT